VRAYSTRDFYAKTMAVLGLGALAGVGAVVDGWPGAVDAPRVTPAAIFAETVQTRPALILAAVAESGLVPSARARSAGDVDDIVHAPVSLAAYEPVPLTVTAEVIPTAAASEPQSAIEPIPMLDVRDAGPVRWSAVELAMMTPPASASEHKPAGGGVLTTAFKKTGNSLAAAGKKTGGKAIDAARAVGSAFRKAFPL